MEVRGVRKGFTEHMLFELGLEKGVNSYQTERIRKDKDLPDTIILVGKVQDMKKHALLRRILRCMSSIFLEYSVWDLDLGWD